MTAAKTATYKGRTYKLLFLGDTKYGRRAHLSFMDGSKDFWVDASLVTAGGSYTPTASRGRSYSRDCCGYPCPVTGKKCTPSNPCHDCL